MRFVILPLALFLACVASAAELESRVLTTYVPQDTLEIVVRTEGWTELKLDVKGGVRKGDTVRLWAGGLIDRGNGDQPGQNVNGPDGVEFTPTPADLEKYALSAVPTHAFALLVKTEPKPQGFDLLFKSDGPQIKKCLRTGKPLEIKLSDDNQKVWIGFNDERGRYADNRLGKGRRHELDPLWMRVEVVRTVVD
jgi:hypothetical protein